MRVIEFTFSGLSLLRFAFRCCLAQVEWDEYFYGKGNHDRETLVLYEKVFDGSTGKAEDKWDFYYFIARQNGAVVAATFFTNVVAKDDMVLAEHISEKAEVLRRDRQDPYLWSSKVVMLGTPVSTGQLLYLDRSLSGWKASVRQLTKEMESILKKTKSSQMLLRGLSENDIDADLEDILLGCGFSRMNFMDHFKLSEIKVTTPADFLSTLKSKQRNNLRRNGLDHIDNFYFEVNKPNSREEIRQCYDLYLRNHERARVINVFQLPFEFFEQFVTSPNRDLCRIYKKDGNSGMSTRPIGMVCGTIQGRNYGSQFIGFEKGGAGEDVNLYEIILYFVVQRAISLGCTNIDFGYTCGTTKRKFGCDRTQHFMYVQLTDFYNQAQLAAL